MKTKRFTFIGLFTVLVFAICISFAFMQNVNAAGFADLYVNKDGSQAVITNTEDESDCGVNITMKSVDGSVVSNSVEYNKTLPFDLNNDIDIYVNPADNGETTHIGFNLSNQWGSTCYTVYAGRWWQGVSVIINYWNGSGWASGAGSTYTSAEGGIEHIKLKLTESGLETYFNDALLHTAAEAGAANFAGVTRITMNARVGGYLVEAGNNDCSYYVRMGDPSLELINNAFEYNVATDDNIEIPVNVNGDEVTSVEGNDITSECWQFDKDNAKLVLLKSYLGGLSGGEKTFTVKTTKNPTGLTFTVNVTNFVVYDETHFWGVMKTGAAIAQKQDGGVHVTDVAGDTWTNSPVTAVKYNLPLNQAFDYKLKLNLSENNCYIAFGTDFYNTNGNANLNYSYITYINLNNGKLDFTDPTANNGWWTASCDKNDGFDEFLFHFAEDGLEVHVNGVKVITLMKYLGLNEDMYMTVGSFGGNTALNVDLSMCWVTDEPNVDYSLTSNQPLTLKLDFNEETFTSLEYKKADGESSVLDSSKYEITEDGFVLSAETAKELLTSGKWIFTAKTTNGDVVYNVDAHSYYTLTVDIDGNTTDRQVEAGDKLNLETPSKTGWTFVGWKIGTETVDLETYVMPNSDVTVTAYFEINEINKYTVTFKNGEDVLAIYEMNEGETPEYKGEKPYKSWTAEWTYTFSGWDPEIVAATSDATYTAVFAQEKRKYTVEFANRYYGTEVYYSYQAAYGEMPEYKGDTPTTSPQLEFTYTFWEWDREFTPVTENTTYYAKWMSSHRYYTITFKNGEEVLATKQCRYNDMPSYDGETPVKPSEGEKRYVFDGWDKELAKVTEDTVYTAKFKEKTTYTVTFKNGEEILATYELELGAVPEYKGATPTKPDDDEYTYTFNGWDKELTAVTDDATYTAQFNPKPVKKKGCSAATLAGSAMCLFTALAAGFVLKNKRK